MYFTRFGYFIIFSIILVVVVAVALIASPFGFGGEDDSNGDNVTVEATATVAPSPTAEPGIPTLSFQQVVNFATYGALVDIVEGPDGIIVNLRPDFDVSGLGTTSHTFTTTLPPGFEDVTAALEEEGFEVNTPSGVTVIQQ